MGGRPPFTRSLPGNPLSLIQARPLLLHLNAPLSPGPLWDSNDISLALIGLQLSWDAQCFSFSLLPIDKKDTGVWNKGLLFVFLPSSTVSPNFRFSSFPHLFILSLRPSSLNTARCISPTISNSFQCSQDSSSPVPPLRSSLASVSTGCLCLFLMCH